MVTVVSYFDIFTDPDETQHSLAGVSTAAHRTVVDGVVVIRLEDRAHRTSLSVAPSIENIVCELLVNGLEYTIWLGPGGKTKSANVRPGEWSARLSMLR
jgi:hypothetical protein